MWRERRASTGNVAWMFMNISCSDCWTASSVTDFRVAPLPRWLWGSMPSIPAISCDAATIRSGSIPVSIPISASIVTRSSVGKLPREPSLVGIAIPPPIPQIAPSSHCTPASSAARMLAVAMPERLWMWKPKAGVRKQVAKAREQPIDVRGIFHAERAGEIEAADAAVMQPPHHGDDVIFRDQALIGAPERHAERHHERNSACFGDPERFEILFDRLVDRHVLVLAGVGRADRDQAEHLVDTRLCRPLGAAGVGDQRAIDRSRPALDALEHFFGVAQMRNDLRMRKAGDLDHGQAQIGEPIDNARPWCRYRSSAENSAGRRAARLRQRQCFWGD